MRNLKLKYKSCFVRFDADIIVIPFALYEFITCFFVVVVCLFHNTNFSFLLVLMIIRFLLDRVSTALLYQCPSP